MIEAASRLACILDRVTMQEVIGTSRPEVSHSTVSEDRSALRVAVRAWLTNRLVQTCSKPPSRLSTWAVRGNARIDGSAAVAHAVEARGLGRTEVRSENWALRFA